METMLKQLAARLANAAADLRHEWIAAGRDERQCPTPKVDLLDDGVVVVRLVSPMMIVDPPSATPPAEDTTPSDDTPTDDTPTTARRGKR